MFRSKICSLSPTKSYEFFNRPFASLLLIEHNNSQILITAFEYISMTYISNTRDTFLIASPKIKEQLARLHSLNDSQGYSFSRLWYHIKYSVFSLYNWQSREAWNTYNDLSGTKISLLPDFKLMRCVLHSNCTDQLLSHSKETCELMSGLDALMPCFLVLIC